MDTPFGKISNPSVPFPSTTPRQKPKSPIPPPPPPPPPTSHSISPPLPLAPPIPPIPLLPTPPIPPPPPPTPLSAILNSNENSIPTNLQKSAPPSLKRDERSDLLKQIQNGIALKRIERNERLKVKHTILNDGSLSSVLHRWISDRNRNRNKQA